MQDDQIKKRSRETKKETGNGRRAEEMGVEGEGGTKASFGGTFCGIEEFIMNKDELQ